MRLLLAGWPQGIRVGSGRATESLARMAGSAEAGDRTLAAGILGRSTYPGSAQLLGRLLADDAMRSQNELRYWQPVAKTSSL